MQHAPKSHPCTNTETHTHAYVLRTCTCMMANLKPSEKRKNTNPINYPSQAQRVKHRERVPTIYPLCDNTERRLKTTKTISYSTSAVPYFQTCVQTPRPVDGNRPELNLIRLLPTLHQQTSMYVYHLSSCTKKTFHFLLCCLIIYQKHRCYISTARPSYRPVA